MSYSRKLMLIVCLCLWLGGYQQSIAAELSSGPYGRQVAEQMAKLHSDSEHTRAGAAEALGFLRAYDAEQLLIERLRDRSAYVRRQVAMALAWCGSRKAIGPLLEALDDTDVVTRQAAYVALTNLSGMELPFDAMASAVQRSAQIGAWHHWWAAVAFDQPPAEVIELLEDWKHRTYSTTSFEIQVAGGADTGTVSNDSVTWQCERGLRALGTLGGAGATEAILQCLGPIPPSGREYRPMVRAGIRSLGRLRDKARFSYLLELLGNVYWARYAAHALGDFGDRRAVGALLTAYRKYCKKLDGSDPAYSHGTTR